MILLRPVQKKDVDALFELANIPGFLNLPQDKDLLMNRVRQSMESFAAPAPAANEDKSRFKFIFVAEDLETHRVLGTSMVAGQHGTKDSPHLYFEVGTEKKFSSTINTGFIHGTIRLKYDTDGPSEIGGLVLDPEFRNSDQRVGRQLSFVRFLYLGLNRSRFRKKLIAELLPPLNKRGQSPLWEAVGRRFTNMDYWEADQLCQKNKEFIFSLFPTGKIYTAFFTAEARNAIGKVGDKTLPVYHMLTKIGFEYKNQVDPFDGGPHLWADVADLTPIQKLRKLKLDPALVTAGGTGSAPGAQLENGLVCSAAGTGEFQAVAAQMWVDGDRAMFTDAALGDQISSVLGLRAGEPLHFMPYY